MLCKCSDVTFHTYILMFASLLHFLGVSPNCCMCKKYFINNNMNNNIYPFSPQMFFLTLSKPNMYCTKVFKWWLFPLAHKLDLHLWRKIHE